MWCDEVINCNLLPIMIHVIMIFVMLIFVCFVNDTNTILSRAKIGRENC